MMKYEIRFLLFVLVCIGSQQRARGTDDIVAAYLETMKWINPDGLSLIKQSQKAVQEQSKSRTSTAQEQERAELVICFLCGQEFKRKNAFKYLRKHLGMIHKARTHTCLSKDCVQKFISKKDLIAHVNDQHTTAPIGYYGCHYEGCNRYFRVDFDRFVHEYKAHDRLFMLANWSC
jgi:hypothetical protein